MINVLVLDIDGVLTDGKVTLDDSGRELKTLSYEDIDAVFLAQRRGIKVVLMTGEASLWVDMIARRLEICHIYKGAKDKCRTLLDISTKLGVDLQEVCYIDDSLRNTEALAMVGLGLVPAGTSLAAAVAPHRVLKRRGGNGAVAEAVNTLLRMMEDTVQSSQSNQQHTA